MLKAGLATVYEAKSGAEFGNLESKYRRTEAWAKLKRKGIWSGKRSDFESPRDYKTRIAVGDEEKKGALKAVASTLASTLTRKS
jgi:endonuclease YncB( thermonuclease family)